MLEEGKRWKCESFTRGVDEVLMDEELVEGKGGGGWRLLDGTKYHHVEMEESRQRQQRQASIHPSIHSHTWVVEINNCDDILMNWDKSLIVRWMRW